MIEKDKGTVARLQGQLLAYHRAGMTPTQSDVTTLWNVVKHFEFDVFERAMGTLQSSLWRGEYPPNPSDIVAQCNTVAAADAQKVKSSAWADGRHVAFLDNHMDRNDDLFHSKARQISEEQNVDMGVAYARSILQMLEAKA